MYRIWALCFLLLAPSLFAADYQEITLTVTNAPTTNQTAFKFDGTDWLFTNNAVSATDIATNTTIAGSATNLYLALVRNRPSKVQFFIRTNATTVIMRTFPGLLAPVSISNEWGTLTIVTNSSTNAPFVQVPFSVFSPTIRTQLASGLVEAMANSSNTFARDATPLLNHAPKTNAPLTTPQITGGFILNVNGTNLIYLSIATGFATNFTALSGMISNSVLGAITEAWGTLGNLTNGALFGTKATNFTGYFTNPVIASASLVAGTASNLSGTFAAPVLVSVESSGIGGVVILTNVPDFSQDISPEARFDSGTTNALCGVIGFYNLGVAYWTITANTNSFAIGGLSGDLMTLADDTVTFGASFPVAIAGKLQVGTLTNTTFTGTNNWRGDLAFPPVANSALANGNNAGVLLGTNVYTLISGPSASYTNAGFIGTRAGDRKLLEFDNPGTYVVLLNESGLDATAANRMTTGTGGALVMTNNPAFAEMIYSGTRWKVLWTSN
jgi:hypothetical protein